MPRDVTLTVHTVPCMDCGLPANSVRCKDCCARLRSGRPWERLKLIVFHEETHCWICGDWVNQDLPQEHAKSRTVDHVQALRDGGPPLDRNNCRLAHRGCNTARTNQARGTKTKPAALIVDIRTI